MSRNSIVNPEARSLYTALLRELFELEQNEKSKEAYDSIRDKIDRIIELEPNNEDAYFWAIACDTYASIAILGKDDNAAQYSIEMGKQAEWLHNHSHTMDSNELVSLYEGMTTALLKLDRIDEAEKYCKQGLENQPDSTLLIRWKEYINKHKPGDVGSAGPEKKSGCFIATASYNSAYSSEVLVLKSFRDVILLNSRIGRGFVRLYYTYSPAIAGVIRSSNMLRFITCNIIVRPMVILSKRLLSLKNEGGKL